MFKQAAFAVAAAAAFVAAPASALVTVNYPGGQTIDLQPDGPGEVTGGIRFRVDATDTTVANSPFTATFFFDNTFFDPARAATSLTFSSNDADSISFTSVLLDGNAPDLTQGPDNMGNYAFIGTWYDPVSLGTHRLDINGTFTPSGNNNASVSGLLTLNDSLVPEPATWALFILGFGAVGHTMRRRSSKVRIAKASLNFA